MRTRWAAVGMALGLALLVTAVVTFVALTRRFDATLSDGRQVSGVVTELIRPAAWDPLDDGRIGVSFSVDAVNRHAKIWLDNDLSKYHVGERLPLWVRGSHVRTKDDVNGPAPLALALLLAALAGFSIAVFSGLRLRGRSGRQRRRGRGGVLAADNSLDRHPILHALLWLAMAVGFGGGAAGTALQAHALATRGVLATAVVLRTEEHNCRGCNDDVFVAFTDQNGREYSDVDVGDVRRPLPEVGSQWTIRYDAHDPSGLAQDARLSPDWIGPALLALVSAGFLWCAWRARQGRLPRWLYHR